ncbi:saccharopine dehydrogenase [Auricularia subglabra TFB-10046 SS5]|uniref:Saccharopine dehydrogenase n=1 Tax=Auricularia subglabra (strain TFB-10046 / SS5) TaxID=717982 RepID=J0DCW7_AURST|nr:saccharopine dehydrogenase [Auricularia subglabra TFB-10046 SS5]
MAGLTHPSIKDGWFREISSQWPGQAMTLKVNRILHVEKSLYQDVLVFESETYGNVLVLDGVIQCTERDEFSYQEMIAHLPLSSHPNPKKVLVIGGGDGGVVREVLKHDSVDEVVLCDIDEAVIRVSKIYLPHMSALLESPRVRVHIGDGFKFLSDNTSTYDVIITDSSDPVGPAASLFQKPYFQLLHDALAPGGHISTQGEAMWLHLPLIRELRQITSKIFPVSEYAFTTIPTYPSGHIGFVICSKEKGRDMRTPLRTLKGTRYWNPDVHRAAFVLPEFARAYIEDGVDLRPQFGAALQGQNAKPPKKVLVLGSGFVARPCAEYVVRDAANQLTVACRTLATAEGLAQGLPRTTATSIDVGNPAQLEPAVAAADLVISLVPYTYHAAVIKAAIKGKTHVVTTSYVSPAMRELDAECKAAGIVCMNEIGLDPGIDHLYAVKIIDEIHQKGGKVKEFYSWCGGLPAAECSDNPLGYKFSWSSRGVLLALLNSAAFFRDGKVVDVPGVRLMESAAPIYISPAYNFVGYPNRDSTPFRAAYKIPEAQTVVRGTLRYAGFPQFVSALVKIGYMDAAAKPWLTDALTWAQVTQKATGAADASYASLAAKVVELVQFTSDAEKERIIAGLKWIGLFSDEKVKPRAGNLLDTLCANLEARMAYGPGERDLVMLQHKFVVEYPDGKTETITSTLERLGEPGGTSAMALLVGVPCGIAVQQILDGQFTRTGVNAPYERSICDPIREVLEKEGIRMVDRVL